jgi:hypothetical protein
VDCTAVAGKWQGNGTLCDDPSTCGSSCQEDIDQDGMINVNDLLAVVGGWGGSDPALDLNGNGTVDTPDLLAVIAAWGPCE